MNQKEKDSEMSRQEKREARLKKTILFSLLSIVIIALFFLSFILNPEEFVNHIGSQNGYILAFGASFFAGFSTLTIVSFYGILIAFISGGLNPVILAIVAGTSLALGDMFFYFFGRKGRDLISGKLDHRIQQMSVFIQKRRLGNYIGLFSYIYISFIPLPNDWILLFLASIRFPVKKMNIIIALGDFTHVALLTFLTSKGVMFFS